MSQLSISEFSTYRWSLHEEVSALSNRGIQGIGLWRSKLTDLVGEEAGDLLYSHSIRPSSLSWAGGFTGSCGWSFEEAVDDTLSAIRTAAQLGAGCLIIHPGARAGHTCHHANRLLRMGLERVIPSAVDFGVRLAVEPMQAPLSRNWTITDSFDQTLEIVAEYAPSELGLVLDLYHIGQEMTLLNSIPEVSSRVALVQLADRGPEVPNEQNRCLIGQGGVPIQSWYEQLQLGGFDGFFEVELHGQAVERITYPQMIEHSLGVWNRLQRQSSLAEQTAHDR